MHSPDSICTDAQPLDRLTAKEREVLDLVVARHTTKEIARHLDLAPNTVDCRVAQARDKLGARDRNELVRIYLDLQPSCGKTPSGSSPISRLSSQPLAAPPEPKGARFTLNDAASFQLPAPWQVSSSPRLPEVLDKRFGRAWRVAAIPLGALCIAMLVLVLMAIAETLGVLI
jgi:DNA-binding CsgD family transcriptional regulator